MTLRHLSVTAAALWIIAATPCTPGLAAEPGPFGSEAAVRLSDAQLDQLLAPVALYPDSLLVQILTASTYPLEVVELHRWLDRNAQLSGAALDDALGAQPWDDTVKALARFPGVVAMMDGEIDWTQRLGDAFMTDGAAVMAAVQRLRLHARDAGQLQDNPRARVVEAEGAIEIGSAQPGVVYVPVYDPEVVYGPWWWPGYPPYAWSASYFGPWDAFAGGVYFGAGIVVGDPWYAHWHPDWHHGHVAPRYPGAPEWHHDPAHRGGVPYPGGTRSPFGRAPDPDRVRQREGFRGFEVPPRPAPVASGSRPRPAPPSHAPTSSHPLARPASPLAPQPHGSAAAQSQRGHESLGAVPAHPPGSPSREHR